MTWTLVAQIGALCVIGVFTLACIAAIRAGMQHPKREVEYGEKEGGARMD